MEIETRRSNMASSTFTWTNGIVREQVDTDNISTSELVCMVCRVRSPRKRATDEYRNIAAEAMRRIATETDPLELSLICFSADKQYCDAAERRHYEVTGKEKELGRHDGNSIWRQ